MRERLSLFLKRWSGGARGQSLVEMAVVTPLLIFLMIGVFEVGWALRNYLVLVNVNREITRFAVRPGYLDFSSQESINTSYERVLEWATSSVSEQLPLDFDETTGNTTLIVSHIVVDTGQPCEDADKDGEIDCDCSLFDSDPLANPFPHDDIIIHPGLNGYQYQMQTFGPLTTTTGVRNTRLDYNQLGQDLSAQNNQFNCKLIKRDGVASSNNVIVTELYYDLPQLLGFPFISNPLTDPIPLYTHTTMRLIGAARSTGGVEGNITEGIDTIGPICLVYPMIADEALLGSATPVNIIEHGWLKWGDAVADDQAYISYALQYPQMSLNDFDGAGGIQPGSQVNKITLTDPDLDAEVEALKERNAFIIPTSANPGLANPVISGFVWARVQSYNLSDPGPDQVMVWFDTTTPLPATCVGPGT
jgi:hypothetical protein